MEASLRAELATLESEILRDEFPENDTKELASLANDILEVMFGYDPGVGMNHPS